VTAPPQKARPQPRLTDLEANREQSRIARDYAENLRLLHAATAPAPDVLALLQDLQRLVRDQGAELAAQAARITVLEARPADDEDGVPHVSGGPWCRMKEAMHRTHYSRSGLLALCRRGIVRFDFEGAHRLIDISSVPHKISSASAQSVHSG
jgi:hypothetical protein